MINIISYQIFLKIKVALKTPHIHLLISHQDPIYNVS